MTTQRSDDSASRRNKSGQAMRRKGEEKRQRLIAATTELLRQRPLANLRVADIVREADVSTPNFYLYFDGVVDAVLAAVQQVPMADPAILALVQPHWPLTSLTRQADAFVEGYVAHWRASSPLFRARSVMVSEGDDRFIAAEEAASLGVLTALAQQFGPGPWGLARAGVVLAMLDRLAAFPLAVPNAHGLTEAMLMRSAAQVLVLSVREARQATKKPAQGPAVGTS